MIRVMLVDDHAAFRGAFAFLLQRYDDLSVVAEAGSLAGAVAVVAETAADVVLVDLELPDGNGLDVLPHLRRHNPEAAAIVLTGSTQPEARARSVAAGAVGFLHKSADVEEIVAAIRQVAAGKPLIAPMAAMALMREAALLDLREDSAHRRLAQLTPRERDVLRELVGGYDNQAIAERLNLGTTTVRTHVAQILHKLGLESRLQAALFAVRQGLIPPDRDS